MLSPVCVVSYKVLPQSQLQGAAMHGAAPVCVVSCCVRWCANNTTFTHPDHPSRINGGLGCVCLLVEVRACLCWVVSFLLPLHVLKRDCLRGANMYTKYTDVGLPGCSQTGIQGTQAALRAVVCKLAPSWLAATPLA